LCQTFTFSTLLDHFMSLPSQDLALRFVVVAIETGIDFALTNDQKCYVTGLAALAGEARDLIAGYLSVLASPAVALLQKIAAESNVDFELRLLLPTRCPPFTAAVNRRQ
jgi:hypothetical protein